MTTMLINTTEGLHPARTSNLVSSDVSDVVAFLKKNCTTYGMSVQYAVTSDNRVIEIMNRGRLGKRVTKKLIAELDIKEWIFSWAWAGQVFDLDNGQRVKCEKLDLTSNADVLEAFVFGRSLDFMGA